MPTFDLTIGDKTYRVEIPDPGATPLRVIVDGEPFEVGIVGTEAVVKPAEPAPAPPRAAPVPPPLPHPPRIAVARPASPTAAAARGEVVAPMPGTILAVEVETGQRVEAGQVLLTLEAMKMKNPIRATHGGTVSEIAVQPGQTVAYEDLLVRLDWPAT